MSGRFSRAFCASLFAIGIAAGALAAASPAVAEAEPVYIGDADGDLWATAKGKHIGMALPDLGDVQQWTLEVDKAGVGTIVNVATKGCWGVEPISIGDGAPLSLSDCVKTDAQQWQVGKNDDGTVSFRSPYSGRCASYEVNSTLPPILREQQCGSASTQRFVLKGGAAPAAAPTVDGLFAIADPDAKRFATAQVGDPNVAMLPWTANQVWALAQDKNGNHTIQNTATRGCWTVPRITVGPGSPIQQLPCTGTSDQQWEVLAFSTDGTTRLVSVHSGRCAGLSLTEPGNRPILRELGCGNGANQAFVLIRA